MLQLAFLYVMNFLGKNRMIQHLKIDPAYSLRISLRYKKGYGDEELPCTEHPKLKLTSAITLAFYSWLRASVKIRND
jgi:hypothetical protein